MRPGDRSATVQTCRTEALPINFYACQSVPNGGHNL
jgi:hypothetical protein